MNRRLNVLIIQSIFLFAYVEKTFLFAAGPGTPADSNITDASNDASNRTLRILLEPAPSTLNPRQTMDVNGQRIAATLFRGLTLIQTNLQAAPDLAASWTSKDFKQWFFQLSKNPLPVDDLGVGITAEKLLACFENYRTSEPKSKIAAQIPGWQSTSIKKAEKPNQPDELVIQLSEPNAYLPKDISSIRYFYTKSMKSPCEEPDASKNTEPYITSNGFILDDFPKPPIQSLRLKLQHRNNMKFGSITYDSVELKFFKDEATRTLRLIKGDIDLSINAYSLTKPNWLESSYPNRFKSSKQVGTSVQYLGFNFKNEILKNAKVRKAIALAIDRDKIIKHKYFGFGTKVNSLLTPALPEGVRLDFPFDVTESNRILDEAPYPRGKDGLRFSLRMKTTPSKEGLENAQMIRDQLIDVGIDLKIEVIESGIFLKSIRSFDYDLYSSRWVGIADGSIFDRILRSGSFDNRVAYSSSKMDELLDHLKNTFDSAGRLKVLTDIQSLMLADLPYFPLWTWDVGIIQTHNIPELPHSMISMSGALHPLLNGLFPKY